MADNPDRNTLRSRNSTDTVATSAEADAYLASIRQRSSTASAAGTGRLIFALDATASRKPLWDMACQLQVKMFEEVKAIGGLSVQLVYYRGLDECRASKWISQPEYLSGLMEKIDCRMGHTQIGKVLAHAKRETQILKVSALVFVGDALEENPDTLVHDADELGRLGVPVFMFQEGADRSVEQVFRQIASLSHGAYCRFDAGAAKQLAELLKAVAIFAVGNVAALEGRKDAGSVRLLEQLR
jgi:hypothetical protein